MLWRFSSKRVISFFIFDWLGTLGMLILAASLRIEIGRLPNSLVSMLYLLQIPVVKWWEGTRLEDTINLPIILLISIIWPLFFVLFAVYDGRRNYSLRNELFSVVMAIIASTLVFAGILFLSYRGTSRGIFILFVFLDIFLLLGARIYWYVYQMVKGGPNQNLRRSVLIIGTDSIGKNIAYELITKDRGKINLVGFIAENEADQDILNIGLPVVGNLNQTNELLNNLHVNDAIVTLPLNSRNNLVNLCKTLQDHSVRVHVVPELFDITFPGSNLQNFGGIPVIDLGDPNVLGTWQLAKRYLDIITILLCLVFIAPLFLIIAIAIKISSPGPILYFQPRIGLGGKQFCMVKFRTMYKDAESTLNEVLHGNPSLNHEWNRYQKLSNDPRITSVGKVLRKLSLDELPQLWNILRGDMSLIGPRPFLPSQIELYGKQAYNNYIRIRPGLTGLWQVSGRNSTSFARRAYWDEYYIRNWSIGLDIKILWRTIGVVFHREGAY